MPARSQPQTKYRIESIDILRGLIMLIMALDHTRDFFHFSGPKFEPTNLATTTPILFFTRWITHFCAPTFVFLSGVSAYLAGSKRTKGELSAFLIKRGLWLILVEVVVLSFAFTLDPLYNVIVLQVLWAIGFSMVILGLLVRAPLWVIGTLGALIFFGHDILDYDKSLPTSGLSFDFLKLFFTAEGTQIFLDKTHVIFDLYAVIPWVGVMLLGYVFGSMYKPSFDAQRRKKILRYTGIAVLALFFVFRITNLYGDPAPWAAQRNGATTVISFFNVSKYPPSLLYSFMTIGTSLIILSFTEKALYKITSIFIVYGNVPFFYYILHFYLLRLINVILFFAMGFKTSQIITPGQPFLFKPPAFGFPLGVVYLIWLFVIVTLYFPCRWYSKYKKTHYQWWLSYI
jgi:uncharacterized membrane protein